MSYLAFGFSWARARVLDQRGKHFRPRLHRICKLLSDTFGFVMVLDRERGAFPSESVTTFGVLEL